MTFISMSISSYASHMIGAVIAGIAIGAGAVLISSKLNNTTINEELRVQEVTGPQLRLVKGGKETVKA